MPHATAIPRSLGLQALVLCGPGINLEVLTADEPKALLPIANRPMLWYAVDWCHRAGITDVTLVTPPSLSKALQDGLAQNPYLSSLSPKPDILSPESLDDDTPTGSILRLPEIAKEITGDFLVLPCDLVCELPAESLLDQWMIYQDPLRISETLGKEPSIVPEEARRTSGLGVWYDTKGIHHVKGTETDFVITAPLLKPAVPPPASSSLRPQTAQLLNTMTTDTLNDKISAQGESLPIRQGLIRKHPRTRMLTAHRDAHIYIFPHWTLAYAGQNPQLQTIGEDLVGWWAKATWQRGLAPKLQFPDNRVPPMLAYIHPATSSTLIQRVDTPDQLLRTSLYLASLPPLPETTTTIPSPHPHAFEHARSPLATIAPTASIADPTCLIGPSSTIAPQATLKETVVGASCAIGHRVRLTRCVVLDGAVVEDGCVLA
ncbi:MAG: hypothetical protein Q9191_007680, partial [Dirinaria sp. TL-2023a]